LAHANLLQLVSHHGTDSGRDLGLLCSTKMLRPVGIMNGTRIVFLMSVVAVIFGTIWPSARPGNNFFTDRQRVAARCLPTPAVIHPEWGSSTPPFRRWNMKCVFLWNVTKVEKFALPLWSVQAQDSV